MSAKLDWKTIKDISDIRRIDPSQLYDTTPEQTEENSLVIKDGLTPEEMRDAIFLRRFAKQGVILLSGDVGGGKSSLANIWGWKFKRYFGKLAIMDSKPRPLFGEYIPWSEEFIIEQLHRIEEIQSANNNSLTSQTSASEWHAPSGQIFLKNSVLILEEFKRYCPRDNSNIAICQAIHSLLTVRRHLDMVIIGLCTNRHDIAEKITPEVTSEVVCKAMTTKQGVLRADLYPLKQTGIMGQFRVTGKSIRIETDVLTPQDPFRHPTMVGNAWKDLYNSWNAQGIRIPKVLEKSVRQKR